MARRRGRGEGNIEHLPSGKWRSVLNLGKKNKIRSKAYPTRKQAADWLHEKLESIRRGDFVEPSRLTLGAWLDEWLKIIQPKVEPVTHLGYTKLVTRLLLPKLGEHKLCQLRAKDVEDGLAEMAKGGVPPGERGRALKVLRMAMKKAIRHNLLSRNVACDVDRPKHTRREFKCWTSDEARAFLVSTREHWLGAFWTLALDSGMRLGELAALTWQDVDLVEGVVDVKHTLEEIKGVFRRKPPKTSKGRRKIWIGRATVGALERHRQALIRRGRHTQTGLVFPAPITGRYLFRNVIARAFRRMVKRAGLPMIRPYDLRHTSATLMLAAGAPLKMVSERLGHENVEITLRFYVRVLPSQQQDAGRLADQLFGVNP